MNDSHHLAQLEPMTRNSSHNKDVVEVNGTSHASEELEETEAMMWQHGMYQPNLLSMCYYK